MDAKYRDLSAAALRAFGRDDVVVGRRALVEMTWWWGGGRWSR
jgi:hypothetical protein